MIHPWTELRFINPEIGSGVFATRRIPRGTITWAQCSLDRVLSPSEVKALGPAYHPVIDRYAYTNSAGDYVLCWDFGRFMNHSCRPAVLAPGFDIDVAIRDVEAGEQLTCDYALLNLEHEMPCGCGAEDCRHVIKPNDPSRMVAGWDNALASAFTELAKVEQPLMPFVRNADQVLAAARGERTVPSCAVNLLTHTLK
jgi:hypothetical protein